MMATTARHREISEQFLAKARVEFADGDLLQSSEKAWGAVAHYVKAVAEARGWAHQSHYDVRKNARRLIALTDDPEQCARFFGLVENLHVNFYEETFTQEEVRLSIKDAGALIDAFKAAESRL